VLSGFPKLLLVCRSLFYIPLARSISKSYNGPLAISRKLNAGGPVSRHREEQGNKQTSQIGLLSLIQAHETADALLGHAGYAGSERDTFVNDSLVRPRA